MTKAGVLTDAEEMPRSSVRTLAAILFVGLVVRLAILLWFSDLRPRIYDERDYNAIAVNLVERSEFAIQAGKPTSLRPPLYAATVAGIYALFGVENYQAVRLFQVGVNLLTVLVVYLLGCEVFDRRTGLWAAALFCFYPTLLGHSYLLLTEVTFTFLLCLMCYLMVLFLKRDRLPAIFGAGILLGLAAQTRSVMWVYPPVFVLLLLVSRRMSLPRRLMAAVVFTVVFAATLAPWSVRNTRLEGTLTFVDTMGGRVFEMGNKDFRISDVHGNVIAAAPHDERETASESKPSEPMTQGQMDQRALWKGLSFIFRHPLAALKNTVIKAFLFWQLERELIAGSVQGHFGPLVPWVVISLAVVICGYYVSLMTLGTVGVVMGQRADRLVSWCLLLIVGHIWGIHTLVISHSRYHVPVMPIVILYAASAIVQGRNLWDWDRRRQLWIGLLILGTLMASWVVHFFMIDFGKLNQPAQIPSQQTTSFT